MLNVEVGDYGVLSERACNCPWHALGYPLHLHTIRSYEKLTSEGMHFMGVELVNLVEEVLPARFGGHPTDYQFVEEEENGLTKVSIVVSPRVGAVNESQLVEAVLASLGSRAGGNQMMAQYWQDGKTLRVVRREPYATSASKIQTLHVIKH